jgi:alpha-L-rhamnosidase
MKRLLALASLMTITAAPVVASATSPRLAEAILSRQWKASWIACADAPAREAGVYRFRKVLVLRAVPASFIVHVSADQRFILFVNGRRVGIGPSRGDLYFWRFETFDLSPFLKPGRNMVAATVWSFGVGAPLAQVSDRTGFVMQGDGDGEEAANTDATWSCSVESGHTGWPEGLAPLRQIGQYIVVGPGERLDAARYDWDWASLPLAGEVPPWTSAVPYGSASPRSIREGHGWALSPEGRWLVPDELPPMEYRPVSAGAVVRASAGLEVAPGFPEAPAVIPAHTRGSLLLDRKELVAAYPVLRFSGGRGSRVEISYQEALVKDRSYKGNRNDIDGKRLVGLSDLVLPDGGTQRVFEPLWWRTWRFLQIGVETADEPLTLESLGAHATGYPFEERARFDAGDAGLARIWSTGWRTARLCAHETYVDCPYYEQLQYVGDTRVQALISYVVAGDDRLARQAILAFDHSRRSDGITSERYPAAVPQYIPPFSLLWVGMVHDFWRYRGDDAFVAGRLPGTRSVLDFYLGHVRPDGLVGYVPWWNFIDWAKGFADGVPPLDAEKGGSTAITLQMVNALREGADIEAALGDPARADLYRRQAAKSADAVRSLAWDDARKLVADTPAKDRFSQQANILAILADAIPAESQDGVLDTLLAEPILSASDGAGGEAPEAARGLTLTKASYYFRFYLARAMEKLGRGDEYLPQLQPWREMLDLGLSTWAETPDLSSRSDCHAWSAHPNYDLLTIVAGIKPAAPGFARVRIEPHLGALDRLEASLPHPKGPIQVTYERTGDAIRATVTLPEGLEGEFHWRGRATPLRPGRQTLALRGAVTSMRLGR